MNKQTIIQLVPELSSLFNNIDHIDIKTTSSPISMRQFVAGALSYNPSWLKFLYGVRGVFVRFLGMKQEGIHDVKTLSADDVPLRKGDWLTFFQVYQAKENHYWFAEASDKHLDAYLGVVVDEQQHERLFHVVTIVKYKHWTGPVYFNVIRPFHHIVVRSMMNAAALQPALA